MPEPTDNNPTGIAALARFLNSANGNDQGEMTMQILKLAEEAGEVSLALSAAVGRAAAAWIGFTGQNPRKGVTHSLQDVLDELADVVITAKVAIARLGGDPDAVEAAKVAVMVARYEALAVGE